MLLDGVEIPAENLVGEVDRGWEVLMHTLDFERITAEKLGGLAWVLDGLETRLSETDRLDGARARLASLRGRARSSPPPLVARCRLLDRGDAASAALGDGQARRCEARQRLAREGVELLGLEGLADGHPSAPLEGRIGALYRASVGSTISGGTAEIQQVVIARRGLGLR